MHGTRLRGDVSFSNRAIVCTVLSRHSYMQSSLTPLTDSLGPAMHGHEMKASAPSKTPQCGLDSLYEVLFREQQASGVHHTAIYATWIVQTRLQSSVLAWSVHANWDF